MSSLDPALFSWKHSGVLQGLICVYVDDFLWAGTSLFEKQVIGQLKDLFLIGSSVSKSFKYIGLNLEQCTSGGITLDQFQYAASLRPIDVCRQRTKQGELSEQEKREYRALTGQLNWIAMQTRPDIAFDVCELSATSSRAVVSDLHRLNKVISRVVNDSYRLHPPALQPLDYCHLECYSDASFANLEGNGSQGGFIIFLRDQRGAMCPLYWQSRRIRRVVKSTLSAETVALLECAEAAVFLARVTSELTGMEPLRISCYVDNKSLIDVLYSSKSVDHRRLRIDIAVLVGMLERGEIQRVSWVDSASQLADCLTKRGASCQHLRRAIALE